MKKRIWILLLVVAVLVAAYFLMPLFLDHEASDPETENLQIPMFSVSKDDITQISIKNQNDAFELFRKEGVWYFSEDEEVGVIQPTVDGMAYDFSTMTARNIAEEKAPDFAMYGLSPAISEVTVTLSDGTQHVLHIGNKTLDDTAYYASVDETRTVYCVSSGKGQMFTYPKSNFLDMNLTNVSQDQIVSVTLEKSDGTVIKVLRDADNAWQIIRPYQWTGSTSLIQSEILSKLTGLVASRFETELSDKEMGLDTPLVTVTIEKLDESIVQYVVGDTVNGFTYMKVDGVKYPAAVESSVAILSDVQPFSITEKSIETIGIGSLKSMSLSINDVKRELKKTSADKWLIDGKEASREQAMNAYLPICSLKIEQYAPKQTAGKALGSVRFTFDDGVVHELYFAAYDDRNVCVTSDHHAYFLIRKTNFDLWLNQIS